MSQPVSLPPTSPGNPTGPHAELIRRVARSVPGDGVHDTDIPCLSLIQASQPTQRLPSVYQPSLCIVVQGSKRASLAGEVYVYDALNYLVVSVTLPVVAQITAATPEKPYYCLRISLEPRDIGDLIAGMEAGPAKPATDRGLYVARTSDSLLDAVLRLVRLLDTPAEIPVLAPLAQREITYRVLTGELGHRLRTLARADSQSQRIARAIDLLKTRYAEPLRMEELAGAVHMSVSTLHHRFKAVTAMSPLQFQKQLRLHEARRLMLSEGIEAASAGHRVGYESASQFSREYRRLFGAPPRREVTLLRDGAAVA